MKHNVLRSPAQSSFRGKVCSSNTGGLCYMRPQPSLQKAEIDPSPLVSRQRYSLLHPGALARAFLNGCVAMTVPVTCLGRSVLC